MTRLLMDSQPTFHTEWKLKEGPSDVRSCGHAPTSDAAHVSTAAESLEEIQNTATARIGPFTAVLEVSSKVQALVDDRQSYVNPYTIP
ncbi:hypothetical protein MCOR34_006602 [Pyricularia oryzae]|nr:hypothetical protein MCOR34_006602 [Pyricularia oryzae]